MRRVGLTAAVALLLMVLSSNGFAAQKAPFPISDCEEITRPGSYVLTNDLVLTASTYGYGTGGNCLVISSPHVTIDMSGWSISVACSPFSYCTEAFGVVGGIAIDVMTGANSFSISNGSVEGYVYGIVGEANFISASSLKLTAVVGIALNNALFGIFKDIAYQGADPRYHASNGPIVELNGSRRNTFTNLTGDVGSDLGGPDGVVLVNSIANKFSGLDIQNISCGGADVLFSTNSSYNVVTASTLFNDCGGGIEVDEGSKYNTISNNDVTISSPMSAFAMSDQNPKCRSDVWKGNSFSNIFATGQVSANPAGCIH